MSFAISLPVKDFLYCVYIHNKNAFAIDKRRVVEQAFPLEPIWLVASRIGSFPPLSGMYVRHVFYFKIVDVSNHTFYLKEVKMYLILPQRGSKRWSADVTLNFALWNAYIREGKCRHPHWW